MTKPMLTIPAPCIKRDRLGEIPHASRKTWATAPQNAQSTCIIDSTSESDWDAFPPRKR